ncbi:hypothetical protein M413DRAFT_442481 [Hebeloma cylindrosporum]|uniref:Uncharacterized protein n=1 Tax=Hebeloma cylindrosporum TaxID=76867 RepID=A0A0C2Y3V1_HEBCY|nr:hypothetical protein M413DRAFT_442481 [Hebeloma cylindrosporum h7]
MDDSDVRYITAGSDITARHFIPLARASPQFSVLQSYRNRSSQCILNRNGAGSLRSVTVNVYH